MVRIMKIAAAQAAAKLAGLAHLDPRGIATEADIHGMCDGAQCLRVLDDSGGDAVVIVRTINGVRWIEAAAGQGGQNLAHAIDDAMHAIGGGPVVFQTKRLGLVKRAEQRGYKVTGYIMRRDQ